MVSYIYDHQFTPQHMTVSFKEPDGLTFDQSQQMQDELGQIPGVGEVCINMACWVVIEPPEPLSDDSIYALAAYCATEMCKVAACLDRWTRIGTITATATKHGMKTYTNTAGLVGILDNGPPVPQFFPDEASAALAYINHHRLTVPD